MNCSIFLISALIIILEFYVQESQSLPKPCRAVSIRNGKVRQRSRGRTLRFTCNPGFSIVGDRYATCSKGRWDVSPPVCVTSGCPSHTELENGLIAPKLGGAVLMFFCQPGYELHGPLEIYCDGSAWNDTLPTCKNTKVNPPTSCDFEKPDLCLWEQDPRHDFDWIRHSLNTPSRSVGTGPSHDHTLGVGNNGHYLYVEATGHLENSTARIMSPLYSANLTQDGCFSFWYHMYGKSMGDLNIYFKAEGETNRTLKFTKSGNQGNQWLHGLFDLTRENTSFQIIMEGVRGNSSRSDIAVDDVAILQGSDCITSSYATTEMIPTDDSDQIEIVNGMLSCQGKCTYKNTTDDQALCQCGMFCFDNHNCCPDFETFCLNGNDTTDFTDSTEMTTTMMSEAASTKLDRVPIPINPKDDIDPFPPKPQKASTTAAPTKRPSSALTKKPSVTPTVTPTTASTTTSPLKPNTASSVVKKVTMPGIIAIVVGAIVGIAGMALIVYLFLHRRNSYKNGSSTAGFSDDSDVRFLTSDEMLDFNLARPEDMEVM